MKSIRSILFAAITKQMDVFSRYAGRRFISRKDLGIAYGEEALQQLISYLSIDMVFDVGANAGQYGLEIRRKIGYAGPLVSFEPIPNLAERLRILALNDDMWEVIGCAIDETSGTAQFNIMIGDQFSSLLNPSEGYEGKFHGQHRVAERIAVDVVNLDEAVKKSKFSESFLRGLLKLDTQGTELRILKGAKGVLSKFPAIQMEVSFKTIYAGAPDFTETSVFMASMGYELCCLFPNNYGHFPNLLEMDAIFVRRELIPDIV